MRHKSSSQSMPPKRKDVCDKREPRQYFIASSRKERKTHFSSPSYSYVGARASCVLEVLTAVRRDDDDDTMAEKIDQTMDFLTGEEHGSDDDEREEKKGRGGERVTEPGQSGLPAIWGWEVRAVFHCRFQIFFPISL